MTDFLKANKPAEAMTEEYGGYYDVVAPAVRLSRALEYDKAPRSIGNHMTLANWTSIAEKRLHDALEDNALDTEAMFGLSALMREANPAHFDEASETHLFEAVQLDPGARNANRLIWTARLALVSADKGERTFEEADQYFAKVMSLMHELDAGRDSLIASEMASLIGLRAKYAKSEEQKNSLLDIIEQDYSHTYDGSCVLIEERAGEYEPAKLLEIAQNMLSSSLENGQIYDGYNSVMIAHAQVAPHLDAEQKSQLIDSIEVVVSDEVTHPAAGHVVLTEYGVLFDTAASSDKLVESVLSRMTKQSHRASVAQHHLQRALVDRYSGVIDQPELARRFTVYDQDCSDSAYRPFYDAMCNYADPYKAAEALLIANDNLADNLKDDRWVLSSIKTLARSANDYTWYRQAAADIAELQDGEDDCTMATIMSFEGDFTSGLGLLETAPESDMDFVNAYNKLTHAELLAATGAQAQALDVFASLTPAELSLLKTELALDDGCYLGEYSEFCKSIRAGLRLLLQEDYPFNLPTN